MKANYKQSETVEINRSLIKFAPYNPRKKDPKIIDILKRNIKKVGFLGGIVWNEQTGNLISGHKRVETLDLINKYDGTNDYLIKVEKVDVDEKTEKEQNVFMNSKDAQGVFDYELLSVIINDIDIVNAGISEETLSMIQIEVPTLNYGNNEEILSDLEDIKPKKIHTPEDIEKIKELKKNSKQKGFDEKLESKYLIINFDSFEDKVYICETLGLDIYSNNAHANIVFKDLQN